METPRGLRSFLNEVVTVEEEVTFDLIGPTECDQLLRSNVICWVWPRPLPPGLGDFLLSRHLMQKLGFDENELLTKACQRADERDVAVAVDSTTEEGQLERAGTEQLLPDLSMERQEEEFKIRELLRDKTEEARKTGAGAHWPERLGLLLHEHWDVFRLVLERDPPVKTEPLRVRLKLEVRPVRSRARRYLTEHREFMRHYVEALVKAGLV
jgi:hypothetical protein